MRMSISLPILRLMQGRRVVNSLLLLQYRHLLSKLVQAQEGDRIYDPTCGSGSLLIKASKEVGNENFAIYGQEKNGQTHALCKMNMFSP